ncbi:hypothetical protein Purlil1_2832 [Purpureocillium lilacinum]|uniref:Uncharacterized protein n=1 Tax=Purpureocillium lilacinum TaxID=33203 RepID=A0ABR0C9L2_PURLI|nr:hypothetical protein Purlil1_2832 [Purpureocillium lilacinum]
MEADRSDKVVEAKTGGTSRFFMPVVVLEDVSWGGPILPVEKPPRNDGRSGDFKTSGIRTGHEGPRRKAESMFACSSAHAQPLKSKRGARAGTVRSGGGPLRIVQSVGAVGTGRAVARLRPAWGDFEGVVDIPGPRVVEGGVRRKPVQRDWSF